MCLTYPTVGSQNQPLGYSWGRGNDSADLLLAVRAHCSSATELLEFLRDEFAFDWLDEHEIAPSDTPSAAWVTESSRHTQCQIITATLANSVHLPLCLTGFETSRSASRRQTLALTFDIDLVRLAFAIRDGGVGGPGAPTMTDLVLLRTPPESTLNDYNRYATAIRKQADASRASEWPLHETDPMLLTPSVLLKAWELTVESGAPLFGCVRDPLSNWIWCPTRTAWSGPDHKVPATTPVIQFDDPVPWQLALAPSLARGNQPIVHLGQNALADAARVLARAGLTGGALYASLCTDSSGYCDLSWLDHIANNCAPTATDRWLLVVTDRLLHTLLSQSKWTPSVESRAVLVCLGQPTVDGWGVRGDTLSGSEPASYTAALRDHSSLSLASIEATGELAVLVANASDLMVGPDRLIANARFEQCVVTPVLAYCPDPTVLRRAAVWVWTSLDAVECTDWAGVLACYQSTPARPDMPALVCAEIGAASD